jgi:hypothetical protein
LSKAARCGRSAATGMPWVRSRRPGGAAAWLRCCPGGQGWASAGGPLGPVKRLPEAIFGLKVPVVPANQSLFAINCIAIGARCVTAQTARRAPPASAPRSAMHCAPVCWR